MNAVLNHRDQKSPFLLENEAEYRQWRQRKLALRARVDPLRNFVVTANGPLSAATRAEMRRQVDAFGFVLFSVADGQFGKSEFLELNRRFGLRRLDLNPGADADRVTALRVVDAEDPRASYIPYSNRAMNWHTDGYYNSQQRRINAFALYCVNPAPRGGGNFLFDHEMMYLLIRDQSPELLHALLQDDLMEVPANVQGERVLRDAESGPVFSLQAPGGALNMRYTSRPRNIAWKDDPRSRRALELVREILLAGSALVELRLQARQGIVCNNLLHGREAFQNDAADAARLVYRARYLDAIDFAGSNGQAHG